MEVAEACLIFIEHAGQGERGYGEDHALDVRAHGPSKLLSRTKIYKSLVNTLKMQHDPIEVS